MVSRSSRAVRVRIWRLVRDAAVQAAGKWAFRGWDLYARSSEVLCGVAVEGMGIVLIGVVVVDVWLGNAEVGVLGGGYGARGGLVVGRQADKGDARRQR